jgi:hypothetical protein
MPVTKSILLGVGSDVSDQVDTVRSWIIVIATPSHMILLPSGKKVSMEFNDWKMDVGADVCCPSSLLCFEWGFQCYMSGSRLVDVLVERRRDYALICDLRPIHKAESLYGCRVSDTALIPIAHTIPDLQQYIMDFHSRSLCSINYDLLSKVSTISLFKK